MWEIEHNVRGETFSIVTKVEASKIQKITDDEIKADGVQIKLPGKVLHVIQFKTEGPNIIYDWETIELNDGVYCDS